MDQDIFEIRNFRLVPPKNQIKTQSTTRHPLQGIQQGMDYVIVDGEKLQPTEDFGTVYVGEQLKAMAQIRYKQGYNQVLDYVNIEIIVQKQDDKKPTKIAEARVKDIKGGDDINVPFSLKIEQEKQYNIAFFIKYKAKPFINNPSSAPIIPENQKTRQYRISPKLPFLIEKSVISDLYPTYYLEYSLQAKTQIDFLFKTVSFIPEDLFESQLISLDSSGLVCLKPEEKEKIIFKVDVKPYAMDEYKNLFLRDQATISLGSLFLEWGICGAYMNKSEEVPLEKYDIELQFAEKPELSIKKISKCRLIVSNPTRQIRKAKIFLNNFDMDGIKVLGLDNSIVTFSEENQYQFELGVHLLPLGPGIQFIKGLNFRVENTNKNCTIRKMLQVLVKTQDELLQFPSQQNRMNEVIDFFADNFDSTNNQVSQQSTQATQYQPKMQENDDIQDFFTDTTSQAANNVYAFNSNQNQQNTQYQQNNNNVNNSNSNKQNLDSIFDDNLLDFDSTNSQPGANFNSSNNNYNNNNNNNNINSSQNNSNNNINNQFNNNFQNNNENNYNNNNNNLDLL
ncbi:hypothetical protein TTHERM_00490928 (macronuclear) [Tetrahymena thermophila SB210]|uniref:Uncharacterized protein n=1 Tax=Tetrahymena thermophila (strain SB210) TaxID=312017 RepID=A4VDR9_TETTS|nr:hypothetical protein TTHERM_00490928 [Tetrahymena thermophila SB210]EDK31678.2 hypothetical protein TTHERM_00490928 [Tetrahymena thermophila SB210]|eukprot:XP_001471360.2 hypothetical protein TTHERM_00490928 [Tetrahymena thermophila SB210]